MKKGLIFQVNGELKIWGPGSSGADLGVDKRLYSIGGVRGSGIGPPKGASGEVETTEAESLSRRSARRDPTE